MKKLVKALFLVIIGVSLITFGNFSEKLGDFPYRKEFFFFLAFLWFLSAIIMMATKSQKKELELSQEWHPYRM